MQTLETDDFYLVNIYFPNSNSELGRLAYRLEFNNELLKYFEKLAKKKPLIITGDYNVAHQEIDLARPKDNEGSAGFTPEERAWMTKFLEAGFIDTFRELNGEKIQYSWWSFRAGARERNVGWRIDYFCTSAKLRKHLKKAYILDKIMGSETPSLRSASPMASCSAGSGASGRPPLRAFLPNASTATAAPRPSPAASARHALKSPMATRSTCMRLTARPITALRTFGRYAKTSNTCPRGTAIKSTSLMKSTCFPGRPLMRC